VLEGCEPASSGLYCVYSVETDDTLTSIAATFGLRASGDLSPATLLAESNRPDVVDADTIVPGQKLRIPREAGIVHTVITAETLKELAASYGVTPDSIRIVPGNAVPANETLPAGHEILIPEPRLTPPSAAAATAEEEKTVATPAPAATATAPPSATATQAPQSAPTSPPAATAAATSTPVRNPTRTPTPTATPRRNAGPRPDFTWPATGPISSYFGPGHPLGIDIDFFADTDEPVKAAAAGTVTFAGGDPCCSYGYYVIIEHSGGFTTLYAHLAGFLVKTGDRVRQGQIIARGGRTGYATGLHLHFEIRRDGLAVDPLRYLP
jgi:lipoprotein NlpD